MVDRDTLSFLESEGLIDSKGVLWWQLGYERRKIWDETTFNLALKDVVYRASSLKASDVSRSPKLRRFRVWVRDDVPILLKEYSFHGKKVPVFISVKPISHEGWNILEHRGGGLDDLELSAFLQPHIRGIVIENTDRYLFWYPIKPGLSSCHYQTYVSDNLFGNQDMTCIIAPIHASKFYKNLIDDGWSRGRMVQKKHKGAEFFNYSQEGFKVVPYYLFDDEKKHLTIYPASVFDRALHLPILLKGGKGEPKILGAGYINFEWGKAGYVKLDDKRFDRVKKSLISRLGNFYYDKNDEGDFDF